MKLLLPCLLLTGCVVDVPDNIEELVVFGFEHHAETDAHRRAFVDELIPLLQERWEELEDGYRVDSLNADHLAGAGVPDASADSIVGALGRAQYNHGIDDVVWAITLPDKESAFDNYLAYEVLEEDDLPCFLERRCASYSHTVEQTVTVALAREATSRITRDHRWVEVPGREPVVVGRSLVPQPVELAEPLIDIHQQYDLFLLVPDGDATSRVETFWIDAFLGDLELPDAFLVDQAVSAMGNQAERIDGVIAGG